MEGEENADGLRRYKDRSIDAADAGVVEVVEEMNTDLGAFPDLGQRYTDWQRDRTKKLDPIRRGLMELDMDCSRRCNDPAGLHRPANGYDKVRLSSSESSDTLCITSGM